MHQDKKIYCNKCGNEIQKDKTGVLPDFLKVEKEWGFFSDKDMEIHGWNLCEKCYDELTGSFKIPVGKAEVTEL